MNLTNTQIEQILNAAPEGATHWDSMAMWKYKNLEDGTFFTQDGASHTINQLFANETLVSLDNLREILYLRRQVELLEENGCE